MRVENWRHNSAIAQSPSVIAGIITADVYAPSATVHINQTEKRKLLARTRSNRYSSPSGPSMYYLENWRVLVDGGRVEFVTDEGKRFLNWNTPIANTTTVVLGTGTLISQAGMWELSKAEVLVGFFGGGGTPLFSANEFYAEVTRFWRQSEYRPTKHLHSGVRFWLTPLNRLSIRAVKYGDFGVCSKNGSYTDTANCPLDHGNYLVYGLGAAATWALGLSQALAVFHRKTMDAERTAGMTQ